MWYENTKHKDEIVTDINQELAKLVGELEDDQAKITLAQFLYRNIGFTTELISGVQLYPDQIVTVKGLLASNYSLCVWGRGLGKTTIAAIYCVLQCIFKPGTKILIAGPTFRTARFIFNHIEKLCEQKEAQMLAAAMGTGKMKRNDEFRWSVNGGEIVAIPLNGEKIRGFRANVLVIDEFLLMGEDIVEKVLIPYLVAPQDIKRRQKIRAMEDKLIARGVMKESERQIFKNESKLIALSSACYTCEYLYKKFDQYCRAIYNPSNDPDEGKYFVSQMAWDSVYNYQDRLDKSIITLASSNESNSANFQREYCAQFIDGSDSYFSMNKMIACTIPDGQSPTLLLKGEQNKKYLLAIDPNASNSETADHFAMCLLELSDDPKKIEGTVVHSYARAGEDLKDHIRYFHYLLKNFNVEIIIIDHAGYQFIEAANESELFKNSGINIKIFEFSSEKDGPEYEDQVKSARRDFNKQIQRIAFTQYFTSDWIRKANEWLQGCIDYKRIWFGGNIKPNVDAFQRAISITIDPNLVDSKDLDKHEGITGLFIDTQEMLLKQTKYQCAAIEVKTSAKGVQTFDLPQIMKRDNTSSRMRRDSYTALMLATWGMKCYYDILNAPKGGMDTFEPTLI